MRYSGLIAVAVATGLVSASPIEKRQAIDDCTILNYALTLEHLEDKFYREGLANYSEAAFIAAGFPDPFYANLKEVSFDETTHVSFLTTTIKGAGCPYVVAELTYAFGVADPKSFVTLASVLEGVGTSAYLGAAASIMNKDYLTAAGAILGVEARHASYLRAALGESGFPEPFDTPLDFMDVFSLAAPFITGGDVKIPFKAFPPLTLACTQNSYEAGRSSVTFQNAAKMYPSSGQVFAVFWCGLNKYFIPTRTTGNDYKIGPGSAASWGNAQPIPSTCTGQIYVALTKSNDPATGANDDNIIAGPQILEVFPKGGAPPNPARKCP